MRFIVATAVAAMVLVSAAMAGPSIVGNFQAWNPADPAYDLVALGTHGRKGIERALLGSVAEATVRYAPCSVLVTH